MISWSDEAASFRDLVTSKAGLGFVLCSIVSVSSLVAFIRGVVEIGLPISLAVLGGFSLAAPFAYLLDRDSLMWAVTRPAAGGLTLVFGAGILGGIAGYTGEEAYIQESLIGLVGLIGATLVVAAIPAAVAIGVVMAIHGPGGRSSGPDDFPEE
ncbi:hypothetical protein [Halorubrum aethiopicum]|uniref:hypothetical protein n=1 Tax=Halorubrum aethiopicum TaxID=1758255 RepID=UPI0012FED38A|nr:hypothetical protein [Halorubrum aethiopicum]